MQTAAFDAQVESLIVPVRSRHNDERGNMMTKPRRARKVVKFLSYASAVVIAILAVAHFAWKYSGSNKWELMREKNGVQIYALKVPGATLKQFKAVTRVKTTLNRIVANMTDHSSESCRAWAPGCVSGPVLKPMDSQSRYFIQSYRIHFDRVLSPRDFVLKTQFSQDPQSKVLLVDITAVPGAIPIDPCCVLVSDYHNTWRFTPLDNGEIEAELVMNLDPGLPYWAFNLLQPAGLPSLPAIMEKVYNKEKYRHTEFAWIQER